MTFARRHARIEGLRFHELRHTLGRLQKASGLEEESYSSDDCQPQDFSRSASQKICDAPLAQLDRAAGYEPVGRGFESLRAHFGFLLPAQ